MAAQRSGLAEDGVYVELGANDGLTHSNSAYLDTVARLRGVGTELFADNFATEGEPLSLHERSFRRWDFIYLW